MDNMGLQEGSMFDLDEGLKKRAADAARIMIAEGRTFTTISINGKQTNGFLSISTERDKFLALDTIDIDGKTIYVGMETKNQ